MGCFASAPSNDNSSPSKLPSNAKLLNGVNPTFNKLLQALQGEWEVYHINQSGVKQYESTIIVTNSSYQTNNDKNNTNIQFIWFSDPNDPNKFYYDRGGSFIQSINTEKNEIKLCHYQTGEILWRRPNPLFIVNDNNTESDKKLYNMVSKKMENILIKQEAGDHYDRSTDTSYFDVNKINNFIHLEIDKYVLLFMKESFDIKKVPTQIVSELTLTNDKKVNSCLIILDDVCPQYITLEHIATIIGANYNYNPKYELIINSFISIYGNHSVPNIVNKICSNYYCRPTVYSSMYGNWTHGSNVVQILTQSLMTVFEPHKKNAKRCILVRGKGESMTNTKTDWEWDTLDVWWVLDKMSVVARIHRAQSQYDYWF